MDEVAIVEVAPQVQVEIGRFLLNEEVGWWCLDLVGVEVEVLLDPSTLCAEMLKEGSILGGLL